MGSLSIPPSFYGSMQNTNYRFPHSDGDTLSNADLKTYWYSKYVFAEYCHSQEDWNQLREDPVVQELVPFYMRCKCMLEHLNIQHCFPTTFPVRMQKKVAAELTDAFCEAFAEFQYDLDRIATITQVMLYWYLREQARWKEDEDGKEMCRKWRDAVKDLEEGIRLSQLRQMPAYWRHVADLAERFRPLRDLAATIVLKPCAEGVHQKDRDAK
jgi:hypothetical protein